MLALALATDICHFLTGIEHYYWCLGSVSGYCDTVSYVETTEPEGSQGDLHLTDGHPVYVSVQVRLMTITQSLGQLIQFVNEIL